MGPIGIPEMIFVFVLALLIFGPRKLPELGRNLGRALTEFRRASNELRMTVEDEMRNLEQDAKVTESPAVDAAHADSGESAMPVTHSDPTPAGESQQYSETLPDGTIKQA